MRYTILALSLIWGCGTQPESNVDQPLGDQDQAVSDICLGSGAFDLELWGEGLEAHSGRLVRAVALEYPGSPMTDGLAPTNPGFVTVAWLSTTVDGDGRFAVSCPMGLSENYNYPAYAAFVDANGSGVCDSGDLGFVAQRYGWNAEVAEQVPALDNDYQWSVLSDDTEHRFESSSICSGYRLNAP